MEPILARLIVLTFFGLAAGISVNAVFLQDTKLAHFKTHGKQADVRPKMVATVEMKPLNKTPITDVRHVAALPRKGQLDAKIRDLLIASDAALKPSSNDLGIVKELQTILIELGYYPGGADGIAGPTTRAAIMAFELDKKLPQTGIADVAILNVLRGKSAKPTRGTSAKAFAKNSQELVSALQKALTKLGYNTGGADGIVGPLTRKRIRAFQRDNKLQINGRISGRLVEAINRARGRPLILAGL